MKIIIDVVVDTKQTISPLSLSIKIVVMTDSRFELFLLECWLLHSFVVVKKLVCMNGFSLSCVVFTCSRNRNILLRPMYKLTFWQNLLLHSPSNWSPWFHMGYSTEPIEQIDWFERYGKSPCLNHQPINSDALHGVIRNPIQQEEVVGKAFSGSVCSLA